MERKGQATCWAGTPLQTDAVGEVWEMGKNKFIAVVVKICMPSNVVSRTCQNDSSFDEEMELKVSRCTGPATGYEKELGNKLVMH